MPYISSCLVNWLYKLFMSQACVYENKAQYDKSNEILTQLLSALLLKGSIDVTTKTAVEAFQTKMGNKENHLAFWKRKHICNSYDAMTTSPVESMNKGIKHTAKASTPFISLYCFTLLI
jgi:hypothetical protein